MGGARFGGIKVNTISVYDHHNSRTHSAKTYSNVAPMATASLGKWRMKMSSTTTAMPISQTNIHTSTQAEGGVG